MKQCIHLDKINFPKEWRIDPKEWRAYEPGTSHVENYIPVVEKFAYSLAIETLKNYIKDCPFGCLHGDVGDESTYVECEACKPARETLRSLGIKIEDEN